jgi:hypothetical protein
MTEAEWLVCSDPKAMLDFLRGKASDRKLRLFIAACYRRIWHLDFGEVNREVVDLDEPTRQAVEAVEQQAEEVFIARGPGRVIDDLSASDAQAIRRARCLEEPYVNAVRQFAAANTGLCGLAPFAAEEAAGTAAFSTLHKSAIPEIAAPTVDEAALEPGVGTAGEAERALKARQEAESRCQADLLREIFGNLFRPVHADSAWLAWNDGTVRKLAQAIHDERRFGDLPILADALEEAGCANADILAHCRQPGEHVCGCWVVDLLLAKE